MIKIHIEIIATDVSRFSETGFGGIESCKDFYLAVKNKYPETNFNIVKRIEDLETIVSKNPDFVAFGFKYLLNLNKKIWLSDFFAKHHINFLGSLRESIEYDSDKVKAKKEVAKRGIETPPFFVATPVNILPEKDIEIEYPLFVKPVDAACSFGVDSKSLVYNYYQLNEKVRDIYKEFNQPSLVEKFLPGQEFTVVILGNKNNLDIMPIELDSDFITNQSKFLPREVKVANIEKSKYVRNTELKDRICKLAKKVYLYLGARDFARIDIKLDSNNIPHFLEINMMPGFTKGCSYFPIACEKNHSLSYDETVLRVLETGLRRLTRNDN